MGVGFARFGGVMMRMMTVSRGGVGMVRAAFMVIFFVVPCRFAVMMGRLFMVLCGGVVMTAGRMFLGHSHSPVGYAHRGRAGSSLHTGIANGACQTQGIAEK